MRMAAAAAGIRAPVQVLEGNHCVMEGTCAWWDGIAAGVASDQFQAVAGTSD
jgi:hypothetical protein